MITMIRRTIVPNVLSHVMLDNRSLTRAAQNQRFGAARVSKRYAGRYTSVLAILLTAPMFAQPTVAPTPEHDPLRRRDEIAHREDREPIALPLRSSFRRHRRRGSGGRQLGVEQLLQRRPPVVAGVSADTASSE